MKVLMKSLLIAIAAFLVLAAGTEDAFAQPSMITAPAGTSQIPSDYVDITIPDDPIFIFCSPDANGDTILGDLSVLGGALTCNFQWMLYNPHPDTMAFQNYGPEQIGGTSSSIDNLESGFYQVVITQNPGAVNEQTWCRRAHVYVNNTIVSFDPIPAGCQPFTLTGGIVEALDDFTIYDPPPTPFVVDSTTEIEVCFWADHTYVSDLGFYLLSPAGDRVDLMPPISAWDQGIQVTDLDISVVTDCDPNDYYTNCNSGNDIQEFCFTSALPAGDPQETPCICDMPTPLTGTFASCDAWDAIYGSSASNGGWEVQIYDCTPADIGYLQKVVIKFTGQSECGLTTYEYNSGPINVTINDNACDPTTAAIYTVPMKETSHHTITNEVTAEWSSYPTAWNSAWGSQTFDPLNPPVIDPEPTQSTNFYLTVYDHIYDTLGIEITSNNYPLYQACEPQAVQYFETLPTDATILSYPTTICQNAQPVTLTPLYYGGTWWCDAGIYPNGPITTNGSFNPSLALLGNNTVCYYFGGVCADSQCVVIEVVDAPVISNIEEECNGSNTQYTVSFTVAGGNVGGYLILNQVDSSFATGNWVGPTWTSTWINSGNSYNYIITDNNDCDPSLLSGTYNCTCTSDAGIMPADPIQLCETDQADVQVLPDALGNPTYFLDSDDGYEYFLHTEPFGALGTIIDHNTTGIFSFTPGMNYNQTYYISQVVGNNLGLPTDPVVNINDACLSVAQGTPVTWYQMPTSNAGLDDFICGTTIELQADTPLVGIGTWSMVNSSGVQFSPNFNVPDPTITVPYFDTNQYGCFMNTEFTFRYTVSNGPCQTFDDVDVLMKPIPDAFAGDDITVCGFEADLQATWSSLCGPIGQSDGEWFGPGTITSPQSTSTVVNVYTPGTKPFKWVEYNGDCVDEDWVYVTFLEQPVIDANHDDSVCGTSYDLQAISTMGVGWWEGPANTFFSAQNSPSTTAEVTLNGASSVTATFTWNEQNENCYAEDTVSITYSIYPTAAAGSDHYSCDTTYTFDADILGSEYAEGTWKTDFPNATFDDKHDPNATVAIPNTGSFPWQPQQSGTFGDSSIIKIPFVWVMDNNRCTDEDTVIITFYQHPVANAGPDTSVCGKIYNMLGEYSIGNSDGLWTLESGPGVPTFQDESDPKTQVQVTSYGMYTFKWKEDNGHNSLCTDEILVNVYFIPVPEVYAGPDRYICGDSTTLEAQVSTNNGVWNQPVGGYVWEQNNPNTPTTHQSTNNNDVITYVWQEYNEYNGIQCVEKDSVDIVFMKVPDAQTFFAVGTSRDHVCGKLETSAEDILQAQDPGITGPNVEAFWIGNDAVFSPNSFAKDPDSVRVGNYGLHKFYWVIENHHGDSVCIDTSDVVEVEFIEQPIANAGPLYDTACIDEEYSKFYQLQGAWHTTTGDSIAGQWVTSSTIGLNFWNVTPTDTMFCDSLPSVWIEPAYVDVNNPEVYEFAWLEQNFGSPINGNPADYCSDWDTTIVTFAPRPSGQIVIDHHPICLGETAVFSAFDQDHIIDWDWNDIDDGIVTHSASDSVEYPGQGPIWVKWKNVDYGDEHFIRLVTTNTWECKSIADYDTIREPEKYNVSIESEPASCGNPTGSIVLGPEDPLDPEDRPSYKWITAPDGFTFGDVVANTQEELPFGEYVFNVDFESKVLNNDSGYHCVDTFTLYLKDSGYVASLFNVPVMSDTAGISPHTVSFTNLSYYTDAEYVTPTGLSFYELASEYPSGEELDVEYEWRFYHIRFDSLPDFDAPAEIYPWEDPIEIDGETFIEETDPTVVFEEPGHYKIQMIAKHGAPHFSEYCRDTIVIGYTFTDATSEIVEGVNVFTPNGDGQNDYLEFETKTLKSMKGQVFSRWGKLVYEWTWNVDDQEPDPGWWDGKLDNGSDAAPGVYFYVIEGVGLDGTVFSGDEYAKAFHLIRE